MRSPLSALAIPIPAPLRCPRTPLGLHVGTRPGNVRGDVLGDFDKDAGETRKEVTYAEPASRLSDHGLLGWFFVGEEGFQHDVQPASFQKTHADEFHSHAATHMHAANDGARLHFALRRIKK